MNLYQLATRGINLDELPSPEEVGVNTKPLQWQQPAQTTGKFSVPDNLHTIFDQAAEAYGVDADVLRGIAYAESRFRPDVISGQVKSSAGAVGLMQFMPATAKQYGIEATDPIQSIFGAAAYMRDNLDKFDGDYGKAVAAYNWGPNRKAFARDDWDTLAPKETQNYLRTVFSAAARSLGGKAERPLPQGVKPSQAGAGRGVVNPGDVNTAVPQEQEASPVAPPVAGERTWSEAGGDTAKSVAQGLLDVASLPGVAYSAATGDWNNRYMNAIRGTQEVLQDQKSPALQAEQRALQEKLKTAEGWREKFAVGAVETLTNPSLMVDTLARSAPGMVAGGFAGRAAGLASNAVGNAAIGRALSTGSEAAARLGVLAKNGASAVAGATAVGTAATQQGASVANDVFTQLQQLPIESFASEPNFAEAVKKHGADKARDIYASAAANRAMLMATGASVLSMKFVPGGDAIEKLFLPASLKNAAGQAAVASTTSLLSKPITKGMTGGAVSKAAELAMQGVKVGGMESFSEGMEEGSGAAAQGLELSRAGQAVNLAEMAGEAGGQGAAAGLVMGKVSGMTEAYQAPRVENQPTTPQAPPAVPPANQQTPAAPNAPVAPAAPPAGTTQQAQDAANIAAAINELEGNAPPQAAVVQPTVPATDAGTAPMDAGAEGATTATGSTGTPAVAGQSESEQSLTQPSNYTGTPSATVGTQTNATAGPGFTASNIGNELAAIKAKSANPDQALQQTPPVVPASQPAAQPKPSLLADDEAAMLADFEKLYQSDLKGEIRQRLGMATPEQARAEVAAVKQKRKGMTPFKSFLRDVGIRSSLAADITGEGAMVANRMLPGAFRKNGMNLDLMVSAAIEQGFMLPSDVDSNTDNGGVNELVRLIQQEFSGKPVQRVESQADDMAKLSEDRARGQLDDKAMALGLGRAALDMPTEQLASVIGRIERRMGRAINTFGDRKLSRLEARKERAAILMADRVERSRARYDAEIQAFAEAEPRIQDAALEVFTDDDGNPVIVDGQDVDAETAAMQMAGQWSDQNGQETATARDTRTSANPRKAGAPFTSGQTESAGVNQANGAEAGAGQEGLTTYTSAEVAARQDAATEADRQAKAQKAAADTQAKKERERKEIAAASVAAADSFELGGNAEDNLSGQAGMFEAQPVKAAPPKAEATPSAPKSEPASKIEDFGEKLPPARRALAAKLSEALSDDKIASLPLSQVWPASENDAIDDVYVAAVAHTMRNEIPAKPRTAYKVKSWASKVQVLRNFASMILGGKATRERFEQGMLESRGLRNLLSKIHLLEQIDRAAWSRIGSVEVNPDAITYVDNKQVPAPYVSVGIDGRTHYLKGAGKLADHMDAINGLLGTGAPETRMQFEIRYTDANRKAVFVHKKGDKEHRRLMEFGTVSEARAAVKDRYDDLVAAWGGVKARDNLTERDLRAATSRERTGQDHRGGKDVTAQEFEAKFGFRGGEFGSWVGQGAGAKDRQSMLNSAYDALMDLADIVGVPPRAISLEGSLGIAFGSRGSGWASAHFEPSNLVINLTKTRGAGTLAHEWFHALDNYFARKRGGEVPMNAGGQTGYRNNNYITHRTTPMMVRKDGRGSAVTKERLASWREGSKNSGYLAEDQWIEDPKHKAGVRAEVEQRFDDLVRALRKSPMLKRAQLLDGRTRDDGDGYWSRTIEMAARAFENYVQAKMMASGYHNDFLANVRPAEDVGKGFDRYPYLMPDESAPISDAFDQLFQTVQTKTDDAGNVAMFSRTEEAVSKWQSDLRSAAANPQAKEPSMRTPMVLSMMGAKASKLVLPRTYLKAIVQKHPDVPPGIFENLPAMLADPLFIIPYKDGGLRVFVQAQTANGEPVAVGVSIGIDGRIQTVTPFNDVGTKGSGLRRRNLQIAEAVNRGEKIYARNKEALVKTRASAEAAPGLIPLHSSSNSKASVLTRADVVKKIEQTGDAPGYSRTTAATGLPVSRIQQIVDNIKARWENAPEVIVVQDMNDTRIPADVRAEDARQRKGGAKGSPRGFYLGGKVYLVAESLTSNRDTVTTILHEALGHYGLRGTFGNALGTILDQVAVLRPALMKSKAAEYGLDLNNPKDRRVIAEEVLAELAQSRPDLGIVKRAIAAIRTWMRQNIPGFADMQVTDDQIINDVILPARAFVERGTGRADGGVRFQRVFHGTPFRGIEQFSTDAIGTGEGAQAFGWGLYFASRRDIAEHYRKKLSPATYDTPDGNKPHGDIFQSAFNAASAINGITGDKARRIANDVLGWVDEGRQAKNYLRSYAVASNMEPGYKAAMAALDGVKKTKGQLYEVEIPEDSEMLAWDLPLSEQPEGVRKALLSNQTLREQMQADADKTKGIRETMGLPRDSIQNFTGADIYEGMGPVVKGQGDKAASEYLASLGIKGIKYPAESLSGGKGGGHNYVVFDGADTEVTGAFFSRQQDQTQTPEFKKWFGDWQDTNAFSSRKAKDKTPVSMAMADGKPMVMYHATNGDFNAFDVARATINSTTFGDVDTERHGVFATPDATFSEEYFRGISGANVMPVYMNIKSPVDLSGGLMGDVITDIVENSDLNRRDFYDMPTTDMWQLFDGNFGRKVVDALKAAGYDGAIMKEFSRDREREVEVWVAFENTQIKSAIGNNGQFDGANPDIRFSRTHPTATTWDDLGGSKVDSAIYESQDDRIDLKRVQENIKKAGRQIREEFDARLAETLFPGRLTRRTESFMDVDVEPLSRDMAKSNITMEALSDFLLARHAPERNAQVAKVNPDMPDGGAGTNSQGVLMTTQAANDYMANLPQTQRTMLGLLARRVDAITKGTREILVNEGLEKADTVAAWEGAYKNYVPLFKDESAETPGHPIGSGFSVTGSASKRTTGSTKEVTNVLAHVLMQREAAITRAEKNRVGMSLYGLALSNPNAEFWTTVKPNMKAADLEAQLLAMGVDPADANEGMQLTPTIRTVDKTTGQVMDRPNPLYKRLENAFVVKVNGEDRVVLFNTKNERAMRMVTSLKNQHFGTGMWDTSSNTVAIGTWFIASMLTQYNPVFGMLNMVRDLGGAMVNMTNTEIAGKQAAVLGNVPAAIKGIARDLRGDTARTAWSDLWVQFQEDGGRTGYRDMVGDPYERTARIEKDLTRMSKEGKLTPGNAAHAILDALGDFNDTIENSIRLSAYKVALDGGMSRAEAARLGRELTVDFNRKGHAGRELGKLYAFLNASVQSTERTIRALNGPAGAKIIAGGLALGVIQALMLAASGLDDEDELKPWVKTRNLIIPTGDKKYITIPLPLGLHIIPNTSRVLTEMMLGDGNNLGTKSLTALSEIMSAANPFGGGGDWTTLHGPASMIAPTVLDPVVDLLANKTFTGNAISKDRMGPWDTRPGAALARESTKRTPSGQVYIGISEALNEVSGGNDHYAGWASPTPEMLRHMAGVIGGGVYKELEKGLNAAVLVARGDPVPARQVPLGSRFAGEIDQESATKSKYFRASRELSDFEAKFKSEIAMAAKTGDDSAVREMQQDPRFAVAAMNSGLQKAIAKLNKLASENISNKEQMAIIDAQRAQLMGVLNAEVVKLEKNSNPIRKMITPD